MDQFNTIFKRMQNHSTLCKLMQNLAKLVKSTRKVQGEYKKKLWENTWEKKKSNGNIPG